MRSTSRALAAVVLAGLLARLILLWLPGAGLRQKAVEAVPDAAEYLALAENLTHHRSFTRDTVPPFRPELFRTPGYPLSVSPLAAVFSSPVLPALLLQLLISLLTIWLVFVLAAELGLGPPLAVTAALLVAVSPNLAFLSTKLVTEPLFTLVLVVTLLLLNRYRTTSRTTDLVGAGVAAGLLILIRPIATYLPLVVAAYVLVTELRRSRSRWWLALLPLACASIVVLPWMVRNGRSTGRYIISTASEHNLYLYNAAAVVAADKGTTLEAARDSMYASAKQEYGPLDSLDEASFWQSLGRVGAEELGRRPLLALKTSLVGLAGNVLLPLSLRPLLVHTGAGTNASFDSGSHVAQEAVKLATRGRIGEAVGLVCRERLARLPLAAAIVLIAAALFHALLLLGAFIGLFLRDGRRLLWLLLPVAYFLCLTGPMGDARFRAPVEPLIALFAAVGLGRLFHRRAAE